MAVEVTEGSGNVFEDIGFSPEEAENLRLRSELMIELSRLIRERGLSQRRAATLLGVPQPRVSDLVRGKLHRFSVESLFAMLRRAGVTVSVSTGEHAERVMGFGGEFAGGQVRCNAGDVIVTLTEGATVEGGAGDTGAEAGDSAPWFSVVSAHLTGRDWLDMRRVSGFGSETVAASAA